MILFWLIIVVFVAILFENPFNSTSFSAERHKFQPYNKKHTNKYLSDEHKITFSSDSRWAKLWQETFEKYGNYCSSCETITKLQVHHKVPLSIGGTNNLSNLLVLCESCHQKLHHTVFAYENDVDIDNYGFDTKKSNSKICKLINAIETDSDITIRYEKKDGTTTNRTVTPKVISEESQRYYLRAFCHLRGAERTFRISRIKRVN